MCVSWHRVESKKVERKIQIAAALYLVILLSPFSILLLHVPLLCVVCFQFHNTKNKEEENYKNLLCLRVDKSIVISIALSMHGEESYMQKYRIVVVIIISEQQASERVDIVRSHQSVYVEFPFLLLYAVAMAQDSWSVCIETSIICVFHLKCEKKVLQVASIHCISLFFFSFYSFRILFQFIACLVYTYKIHIKVKHISLESSAEKQREKEEIWKRNEKKNIYGQNLNVFQSHLLQCFHVQHWMFSLWIPLYVAPLFPTYDHSSDTFFSTLKLNTIPVFFAFTFFRRCCCCCNLWENERIVCKRDWEKLCEIIYLREIFPTLNSI